ncbi:hypothetical protein I6N90_15295 [Paenibacillus sp. GSMTC-2017]|uniref:hypothetical protein n=1 Tax=Paenibacillus sp. GSMTC-2017 TaxID=2794350 RepID=UPI0018D6033D|nr:hypothetical protein [Paenibacillus sp. GSMTC-2017]MBH5319167.1 hypothetical protein [Paenibacillus sp. GSMTC-2017]
MEILKAGGGNIKKKTGIILFVVPLLTLFIFRNPLINLVEQNKNVHSIIVLTGIKVEDKLVIDGEYYVKLSFRKEITDRYLVNSNEKVYRLENKEIYDSVTDETKEDIYSIKFIADIDTDKLTSVEVKQLKDQPLVVLSEEKYDEFITIQKFY